MKDKLWVYMIKLSTNMWGDEGSNWKYAPYEPELKTDDAVWRQVIDYLPSQGFSRLQTEQWDVMENGKAPKETAENLVYSTEEYEIREEKANDVNSYISTEIIYFVSGEKDPKDDAAWENFISTMNSIGREELMKVCQSAYDRQQSK